jgi:hypothetical protein
MMADVVLNTRDSVWCQMLWDMVADGGTWAIPRSGIILQKSTLLRRFTEVGRMPWHPDMGGTAEDLRIWQDSDFEAIRKRFALIGVECSLASA